MASNGPRPGIDTAPDGITIVRPLVPDDVPEADRVMRLAFGTFLGLPDPLAFMGDADYIGTRRAASPSSAFVAEIDGDVVGSVLATRWGSVGLLGPLTVHPDCWDRGLASRLIEPVIGCFERWGTRAAGLFTFANSPRHLGLYQKFGFWPGSLTVLMSREVPGLDEASGAPEAIRFSELEAAGREEAVDACRALTGSVFEGLDLAVEIGSTFDQGLGETVLLEDGEGLAVCHLGPGTEAGSGVCYIKFGAVRPGPSAGPLLGRLLAAVGRMAALQGLHRIVAGVSTARHEAYRRLLASGFRIDHVGVAMHRPERPAYHRPDVLVIDDWR